MRGHTAGIACSAAVGEFSCTESQSLGVKDVQKRTWWTWCEALELAMRTGLAAWGFFLQARMKEVESSRYRARARANGWAVIGKDGLLRVRSCDSNAAVLGAAAVAAHASASQRADRPLQTRPVERTYSCSSSNGHGHPSSRAGYRCARAWAHPAPLGAVWTAWGSCTFKPTSPSVRMVSFKAVI